MYQSNMAFGYNRLVKMYKIYPISKQTHTFLK